MGYDWGRIFSNPSWYGRRGGLASAVKKRKFNKEMKILMERIAPGARAYEPVSAADDLDAQIAQLVRRGYMRSRPPGAIKASAHYRSGYMDKLAEHGLEKTALGMRFFMPWSPHAAARQLTAGGDTMRGVASNMLKLVKRRLAAKWARRSGVTYDDVSSGLVDPASARARKEFNRHAVRMTRRLMREMPGPAMRRKFTMVDVPPDTTPPAVAAGMPKAASGRRTA